MDSPRNADGVERLWLLHGERFHHPTFPIFALRRASASFDRLLSEVSGTGCATLIGIGLTLIRPNSPSR
jgi:hypothetical protein